MAGILVEVIVSWILLWVVCKEHLPALGITPTRFRMIHLFGGLLVAAACCAAYEIMTTAFGNNQWILNSEITGSAILEGSRYTLVSVLYEELIFRGALLYIAIKKLGVTKACFLSASCFGIYHWFTFNTLGNPVMMVITFLMTGIAGLAWAFAFAKTGSMYLPMGLHLGWNLCNMVLFSSGSSVQSILVRANENKAQGVTSLFIFLFQVLALPLITYWYLKRGIGEKLR
ncbi:MAG: CPBP family intramembrane metalloprotease [Cyclobacteriaceae bacterium]|nr:CPBP family intramembrane metalloprotease [Cyclobacteriaceae bacterium]